MRLWGWSANPTPWSGREATSRSPCSTKRIRASTASGRPGVQPRGASGASAATAVELILHA
eukprot:3779721-Alexandrium_andersonii.AAC.1